MTTAAAFRATMAQVPAAVCVVTTTNDGRPHGTTVSAFMSLSMEPPMLAVSLDNDSTLLSRLDLGAKAGINVLTVHQGDIASRFARKQKDGLIGDEWELVDGEPPRLPGSHAWIACTITQFIDVGDHTLVIGTVDTADTTSSAPLLYWQRAYGTASAAGPSRDRVCATTR